MSGKKAGNLKRILANTGWMLFDKVFILILNLVVTVRIANYYGTLGYGTYQYAVSVVALLEILVTFVDARVVKKRYVTENPEELVWNATITRMLFSVVSLVGGIVYLLISGESGNYNVIFLVLLVNAIVINLRFGMQNRYEYLLKSKKVIIASNIALTIGGILQLIAVSLHLSILSIAIITAFSSLLSLIIVYIQYRKEFGRLKQGRYQKKIVWDLVHESLPLAIAASCAIIYSRCDSIMIGNMLSREQVGIYAIAVKLIAVVQIGIAPVRESVYPKMIELYSTNREQYAKRYIQITSILTWIYIFGVLASFVVLPYAFRFLNPEYAEAFPVYQVYVIGTFFMYNAGLRAGHYTLINRGNVLMYSQIISVVLNVIFNYVLIKTIGIYGAAIATGITQGISLMVSNLFFGETGREVFKWQLKGLNPLYIFKK
ncbi:MAG: flippase [Bacillota bacterium]|jgi:O-antigen/teichoic acid export membrane protein